MAKQIEGIYEKVYECAKMEFLSKGFKDASLRRIALVAGTSTGSIYTRFHNKVGLFHAIVAPVVDELRSWFPISMIIMMCSSCFLSVLRVLSFPIS